MDLHRLAEERSLAYHREVAALLCAHPELLEGVRVRLAGWLAEGRSAHHAAAWLALVDGPRAHLLALLVDEGEQARELRQSTPFSGLIEPRRRWRIWREVRERLEEAP